ncbi:MAG: ribonuclease [Pseudomonadota bacterium]
MKLSRLTRSWIILSILVVAAVAYELFERQRPQDQEAGENQTQPRISRPASGEFVLAVTWQPAFCETRPRTKECRSQTESRFDADHFTLHGLWPGPRGNDYCGVSNSQKSVDKNRQWRNLRKLELTAATRIELEQKMPGTQSYLHRHEWIKHGTCYSGLSPERYFSDSLQLLDQINGSGLRRLFVENKARTISANAIQKAINTAFGTGAAKAVSIQCRRDGRRNLIVELRFNLKGAIAPDTSLSELMRDAKPGRSRCRSGVVDRVGLQ